MMTRAATGFSSHPEPQRAAEEAAREAMERLGGSADFVLVFASGHTQARLPQVLEEVAAITLCTTLAGCSARGVFTDKDEIEMGPGVAVLAVQSTEWTPVLLAFPSQGPQEKLTEDIRGALAGSPGNGQQPAGILAFMDPFTTNPYALVKDIHSVFPGATIAGGGASEAGLPNQACVFAGTRPIHGTVLLALFGDGPGHAEAAMGAGLVGETMTVTRCEGTAILELDGRPAPKVFVEMFADCFEGQWGRALESVFIALAPPDHNGAIQPGAYLIRHVLSINPQAGYLRIAYPFIKEGMPVQFAVRDEGRAREDFGRMIAESRAGLPPASLGLYTACVGRGASMYNGIEGIERSYLAGAWPGMPLIGWYSSFEIGPMAGVSQVHNYAGVLWRGGRCLIN